MGVRNIDITLCNGCGMCVAHCPMDVLRMDHDSKKAYIAYIRDCQCCTLCEMECPKGAVYCLPLFERRIPPAW